MAQLTSVEKETIKRGRIEKANRLTNLCKKSIWDFIFNLKVINDELLFVEMGYDSIDDFCINELGRSAESARQYLLAATKFIPAQIPENTTEFQNNANFQTRLEILERLPYRKSAQLIRLPQETINSFFETAELTLGENRFTIEQILEMRLPSLSKFISNFLNKENPKEKKQAQPHNYPLHIQKLYNELVKVSLRTFEILEILAPQAGASQLQTIKNGLDQWLDKYLPFNQE